MNRCTWARVQILISLTFALFVPGAWADPAATVVQFKGTVLILQGDQKMKASNNLKLEEGAVIQTMPNSSIKLQMADKSVVDIGAATSLKVTTSKGGDDKEVDLSLDEGKVRAFVRKKGEGEKGKFTIRTKSATMGVRGTQFLASAVKVGSEFRSSFFCFNGAVFVDDAAGNRLADLKPNQFIAVQVREASPGGEVRMEGAAPRAAPIPRGVTEAISSDRFLASPDTAERVMEKAVKKLRPGAGNLPPPPSGSGPAIDPNRIAPPPPPPPPMPGSSPPPQGGDY